MISRLLPILALLFGLSAVAAIQPATSLTAARGQPNFVVILVDDLDADSVSRMPAVNRHLADSGATFTRFFATTPLCCPSRASILRGQYAHNHRVLRNTGEDAGFAAFHGSGHEDDTVATALDAAGYETALIGKYLNGYSMAREDRAYIPPGWDFWVAGVDHAAYNSFNYELNVNGEIVRHGRNERDYMTDVLAAHALDFLDRATESNQPFFLYLAPYAPHSPATPAPRHKGMFAGESAPRTAAFNERDIRDKPDWVRTSRLGDERISRIDSGYQQRLESLMAVDEMVDTVVRRLDERGALATTYVVFLSDNGYFLGEYRLPHGKDAPYDAASRVPAIVRGPGVAAGSSIERIALNIDLFPTIADFAGIATPSFVDGRSLAPLLAGDDGGWREAALIEGFGKETESNEGSESSTPPFRALRAEDMLYTEYETGERELYDLRKDRHQVSNIARQAPRSLLRNYSRRLDALAACSGGECARLENEPVPKRSAAAKGTGSGKERERARGRDKSKINGPGKDNSKNKARHGKRKTAGRENAAARRQRVPASDVENHYLTVGGVADATASLRLEVPGRSLRKGALSLRVHVASVTTGGSLVAALDTAASAPGTTSTRRSERLGGSNVTGNGWVTIDISSALGDANDLTIILRGRDDGEFSVSGTGSGSPPQFVPEPTGAGSDKQERRDMGQRQGRDRHGERARGRG